MTALNLSVVPGSEVYVGPDDVVSNVVVRAPQSGRTVVFRSQMLLGDAIAASCTIGRYMREHPEDRVIVETLDEYPKEIYGWIPGSPEVTFATDTVCDVRYELDASKAMEHAVINKCGIWISMGALHGLPADPKPILNIPDIEIPAEWCDAFVVSPFSRSCSSHSGLPANKVLPTKSWIPLFKFLRRRGKMIIVSAKQERMPDFAIDESERVAGYSLAIVASVFRRARCVITLDNGLARLATVTGAPTLILMPEFLPLWVFSPDSWSKKTFVAQMVVTMPVASLTAAIKNILRVAMRVI